MSQINTILEKLKKITSVTGHDFLNLSNSFPVLIKELDSKNSSTGANKVNEFSEIKIKLKESLAKKNELRNSNIKFLSEFRNKNNELLKIFSDKTQMLSDVQKIIKGIKEQSEEMEVISLNAMVVSIKSGKEGQAFSYITSNLKQSSLKLISQSNLLIQYGNEVQDTIKNLENEIANVNNLNQQTETINHKENSFMLAEIEQISTKLTDMINSTSEVKHLIIKAMEGIQMQDIIRQSLDDIILTVQKINQIDESLPAKIKLEKYNENCKLAKLSINCICNIKKNLLESISVFTENSNKVNNILNLIDKQRTSFVKCGSEESELKLLKNSMDEEIKDFEDFINLLNSYQNTQNLIIGTVKQTQQTVSQMFACFSTFGPIFNSLQYVAIAQRIEVARNTAIQSIKETVEYMANLIVTSNGNVEIARKQLQEFTETCNTQVKKFIAETTMDKRILSNIITEKNNFANKMTEIQSHLCGAITDFTIFSPDFHQCFQVIQESINNLNELSNTIPDIEKELQAIYDSNYSEKTKLESEHNIEISDDNSDSLLDFLNDFTITSDKQEAGNIAGISIESGAEAGEITFF